MKEDDFVYINPKRNNIMKYFNRGWLTISEVARKIDCSNSDVCQLVYSKKLKIKPVFCGSNWEHMIKQEDLNDYHRSRP